MIFFLPGTYIDDAQKKPRNTQNLAKRLALQLRQNKSIDAIPIPTEVIDADTHIPKEDHLLQPWVANLTQDERRLVIGGKWLTGDLVNAFQTLLKQQFPHLSGLQDVSLGLTLAFEIEASEFVQVLHTGSSHWVAISTIGCTPGEVDIFDSMPPAPTCDLKWQILQHC